MFLSKVKFVAIAVLTIGLAGSGVGFLAHQTIASPAFDPPPPPPVNQDNGRVEAPAPANAGAKAPAPGNPNAPAPRDPDGLTPSRWRQLLSQPVDYPGMEDVRATLADLLDHLSKRYSLRFHVNENAFHAADAKIDVVRFAVADPTAIPPMRVAMRRVLQTILDRLPTKMGAMYLIRKDYIEITTETAVRAELGITANRPLLPLVWETLDNTPIAESFRQLAHESGYNVIVDPRIADKLQVPASAEFNNVPIDTAVRLLANMAGMSMVRLDNVFYVTTADNAKRLREEQAEINADKPAKSAEPAKKPAKS